MLQGRLIFLLMQASEKLHIRVVPEIRIQIHARRLRVADVAVWRAATSETASPRLRPSW